MKFGLSCRGMAYKAGMQACMYLSIYISRSLSLTHTQTNKHKHKHFLEHTHNTYAHHVQQMGVPHAAARRSSRISTPRTPKRTLNGKESMIISPVNAAKKEKHKLTKSLRKGWLRYCKFIVGLVDRLTDRTVFVRV